MDIAHDQFGGCRASAVAGSAPSFGQVADVVQLDWPGLAARLAAAHAARRVLVLPPRPADSASGSFAPGIARALSARTGPGWRETADHRPGMLSSSDVNRDAKADGKLTGTISPNCAGDDRSLVRGLS